MLIYLELTWQHAEYTHAHTLKMAEAAPRLDAPPPPTHPHLTGRAPRHDAPPTHLI